MFRIEENTTLDEFKTSFAEIFSRPLPKQFAIFEAARMRDSKKGLLFLLPESLIPSIPCIKIGDSRLAQWIFLNKLADGDSRRKAMEMWVSDHRWGDILAMIEKLCSSARNKRRQETILEVDDEEDEAPENNGDVNTVHSGGSRPNLRSRGRGGGRGGSYKKGRSSHSSSLCFLHRTYKIEAYNCHGKGCALACNNKFVCSHRNPWGNGRGRGQNN